MRNPTREGCRLVMLVFEEQGDWPQVQIDERPKGATGWVRRDPVELRTVPNHILMERARSA